MPEINDTSLDSELDEILATNGSQNYQVPQSDQYGNMISDQYGNIVMTPDKMTKQQSTVMVVCAFFGVGLGMLYSLLTKRGFFAFIGFWLLGSMLGWGVGIALANTIFAPKK